MRSKLSSISFITFLFLLVYFNIFPFTAIAATATTTLIQRTCRACERNDPNIDYNFCVTSLLADSSSNLVDLHELGVISFSFVQRNISTTIRDVKKLLQKKKYDLFIKSQLSDCLELYSDAMVALEEGKKEYKVKHYEDANIKVSSVMDASRVCEDGFGEEKGGPSPLIKRNNDLFQLTAITLSIINMQH